MPANKGVQAVSQAKNATSAGQKAVTFVRAAGTEVGKDLINGAFSTGVGYGVTELTGNQELGMAAGVLSSFAFGKGLDDIDESLNISGLSRPKGLPKTANHADDFDLSTSHAKSSADVDIVKSNNFFDNQNFNNPSKISGSDYKNADYLTTNGNKYQYDFEARPVGDYNINTTKNYIANTSPVDINFQKPKSYQNRLVTETVGYADDLIVPKVASSTGKNVKLFNNGDNKVNSISSKKLLQSKSSFSEESNTSEAYAKETNYQARFGERKISDELYEKLRKKTPTKKIRDMVNENIDDLIGKEDPAIPGKVIEGRLEADHIVSMEKITRMEGYDQLTDEQKQYILNYTKNFKGLSKSANSSKGSKSYSEWETYKKDGLPIKEDFRNEMIKQEKKLEGIIQKLIDDFLKENKK